MKKALEKIKCPLFHIVDGEILEGPNNRMRGDCTELIGDCTGLSGNCTGLRGDIDDCELSKEEREAGVGIADLVM